MKERAGLPAAGRATMLGLNLAKHLKFPSWLRILPTTTATTNKKRQDVASTSSPSTTSHELPQLNNSELLDTCLQKYGAMRPFHTLFEQSFLEFGTVEPKNEGITSSIEQLQTPCPSDTITSKFEDCNFKSTIQIPDSTDCMLEKVNQSADSLTALANEQASSFTILPSLLGNQVESIPFRAMFPDYLISDQVESIADTNDNSVPALELPSLCPLVIRPLSFDSQGPFDGFFGSNFTTTIKAQDFKLLNKETPINYNDGRTSPESSTISRDSFSSLSDSPYSSRRSSWATSISTHLGDDDIDQCTLGYEKPTAESDQSTDDIELINEYQHYNQLIELGDPNNTRDRDFIPQQPIERHNEVAFPEKATNAADGLADDASGVKASDDAKTPITQAGSDAQQESIQAESMQIESMQPNTQSALESENTNTPPPTPAESAAWAHSYCEEDSKPVKLKVLRDANDREYVLYHHCFHCVPIELAPEFADDFQQEEEDDDGYGSATEGCDTGGDGAKLGTIPEEENEG